MLENMILGPKTFSNGGKLPRASPSNLICQLLVISSTVYDYRKCLISAKIGSMPTLRVRSRSTAFIFRSVTVKTGQNKNLESSTWQVKVDGLGILEGETYQENYPEVVKFLGVPYAETPKRFEHSRMKTDLGFFEAKSFSFGSK